MSGVFLLVLDRLGNGHPAYLSRPPPEGLDLLPVGCLLARCAMPAVGSGVCMLFLRLNAHRGLAVVMRLYLVHAEEVASCFDRTRLLGDVGFLVPSSLKELALDFFGFIDVEFHTNVPVGVKRCGSTVSIECSGETRDVLCQICRELCEAENALGYTRKLLW